MRDRWKQIGWVLAAVGLMTAAAMLHRPLDGRGEQHELTTRQQQVLQSNPRLSALTVIPGGLRAPVVNYLWMRSQELQRAGRVHDARQLAEAICELMPHFDGVWAFHAWNMAWNISVSTHTPDERWQWVSNGMELLRDRGIPLNPESLGLYRELGWLFYSKMGGNTDEMHMVYKQRWAIEMQRVVGAPPLGTTDDVIAAFEPVARAPLDRTDLARTRRIQPGPRQQLLADADVAAYAAAAATVGLAIDDTFLMAYNRWSRDESVASIRVQPPRPANDQERAVYELINDPRHAQARARIVAFIRAQLLWNVYKMDPQWMLDIMRQYDVPLDWRLTWSHALYWVTYGLHATGSIGLDDIQSLNTDRIVLNSLKDLTWQGRMGLRENPNDPDNPDMVMTADWRYIEPTHQEHLRLIHAILETRRRAPEEGRELEVYQRTTFDQNVFEAGHVNYLVDSMAMLLPARRLEQAQEYYDWIRENYSKSEDDWAMDNVEDFILSKFLEEDSLIPNVALSQISIALQTAMLDLALDNAAGHRQSMAYAGRIYNTYQSNAPPRIRLGVSLQEIGARIAMDMLVEPRQFGFSLPLEVRSRLYRQLDTQTQRMVYFGAAEHLRAQAQAEELDFSLAFPKPDGYDGWLEQLRRMQPERDTGVSPRS